MGAGRERRVYDPVVRRERILRALTEVVAEQGFASTKLEQVLKRAGVTRKTFFESFEDLQDGLLALLDLARQAPAELIKQEFAAQEHWQDGLLYALASLLVYFESEPQLARIWFIEGMAAGSWALKRREEIAAELQTMIVEYWVPKVTEPPPDPNAAAGAMASILGLVQNHIITERQQPLTDLLAPMMRLVTGLYLGVDAVKEAAERGARLAREIQDREPRHARLGKLPTPHPTAQALPQMLENPAAHRARQCIVYIHQHKTRPTRLSNRAIAAGIGIRHQPQISKLLAELSIAGLLHKRSEGLGKRNCWQPTPYGEQAAEALERQAERQAARQAAEERAPVTSLTS